MLKAKIAPDVTTTIEDGNSNGSGGSKRRRVDGIADAAGLSGASTSTAGGTSLQW